MKIVKDEKRQMRIGATWGVAIVVVLAFLLVVYAIFNPLVWLWVWLLSAVFSFAAYAQSMLSDKMKKVVSAPVRRPPGLARWDDIYASADPVPNGPTMPAGETDASIKIWNLGSLIADHTAYWTNIDGFVLRVARVCAETAQSPWISELPSESTSVDERAAWRVGFLRIARWSASFVWLVVFVLVWRLTVIPIPFKKPDWVPTALVQFALLATFVSLAMWVTSVVMRWPWNAWVRKEQEAVLARVLPEGKEGAKQSLFWIWLVVWAVVGAAIFLLVISSGVPKPINLLHSLACYLHHLIQAPRDKLGDLVADLFMYGVMIFGFAHLTTYTLLKLRPPPGVAGTPGR